MNKIYSTVMNNPKIDSYAVYCKLTSINITINYIATMVP